MTFEPLKPGDFPIMIGVAGYTGSGKTMSGLRLARGLANGKPFAGIDTENGRMSHYAALFPDCEAMRITAPFRPDKYAAAIQEAETAGYPVVVVDSASHEWYGDGGCLDWHDELMAGDQKKNLSAWIQPKKAHKALVTKLTQLKRMHVILCFRAEPKVEAVKHANGRIEIRPKRGIEGGSLDGWFPITEKNLPYELTASFLLTPDRPGVPRPIKLQEQHKPFVPLDEPLSEEVGRQLGVWAAGGSAGEPRAEEVAAATAVPQATTGESASPAVRMASAAQRRKLFAEAAERGLSEERLRLLVAEVNGGNESTGELPASLVDVVLTAIRAEPVTA